MNEREARRVLSGSLTFGDPLQLHAKLLLAQVASARERLKLCARCAGEGVRWRRAARAEVLCNCVERETAEVLRCLGVDVDKLRGARG